MRAFRPAFLASVLVGLALAGCGSDKTTSPLVPADGLPAGTPQADSPAHLAARLEATWESQVETEYAKLLTDDFQFHFSVASDPDLVVAYGHDWDRAHEIAALTHLFDGYTTSSSEVVPGASTIDLAFTGLQYGTDPDHADSTAQYQRLVITDLGGLIEISTTPSTAYQISSRQELYLVRGDAAVLPAGAVADTTRWYVRGWEDLSVFYASRKGPTETSSLTSLGRVKSLYHDPPTLPAGTPKPDSPEHLVARLDATWEAKELTEYVKLLTDDFRFRFSIQTDPSLVDQYGNNWDRDDEVAALTHLFEGFTDTDGNPIPAASRIDLTWTGVSDQDDFQHADSTAHYRKLVVLNLDGTFEVPGSVETFVYRVSAREELYIVRGDAAVLPAGTTADPTRWYLRRWDDLATGVAARKGPIINPASPVTIGSLRAHYR
jgi:5-keto 4-deoxyuronate isomerase